MGLTLAVSIVVVAIILVVAFVVRQARRVRRLQDGIDYSKVRRWKDDDEDGHP